MRDLQSLWLAFPHRTGTARAYAAEAPAGDAVPAAAALRRLADRERALPYGFGPTFFPSFEAVACADSVNPSDPQAWPRAADRSERHQRWFGRSWTWSSAACPRWPGSAADAYRGPWRLATPIPALIVGNRHDPATPHSGAVALHRLFENSRLVTMDGWGHGAIGESACVARIYRDYLVRLALPAAGTVCHPDEGLYPVR
jgi:hypothetical protein